MPVVFALQMLSYYLPFYSHALMSYTERTYAELRTGGLSWLTTCCFVCQRRCYWLGNCFPCSPVPCTPLGKIPITTQPCLPSMPIVLIGPPSILGSSSGW